MLNLLKKILFGRSIDSKKCKELVCYIKKAEVEDPNEQIVEYDKIYHHALKSLGYRGSFGEILKRDPKEVKNLNEVWELHKLRNTLVHSLEKPKIDLEKQAKRYKKVTENFLKQVTR